jgi:MoaA/NifB/PqqE/SkfB family radical SAM enzyme
MSVPRHGYDVLVNVTNICDARCVMCNIWKNQDAGQSYLPAALLQELRPVSTVSFAGGEPFLHEEIVEIVRTVHRNNPRAKVVFSSNGFRTELIVEKVRHILAFHENTQVTISLDGIGPVHDRIRGIPGAWDKVNLTFARLGAIGLKQRNFAFTITADNYSAIPDVYAHARSVGAGLSLAVAQSSRFLNVEIPPIAFDRVYPHLAPIVEEHLRSWRPFDWARAFFFYGILRYLRTGRRPIACDALDEQFMIDQTGAVFTCHPLLWPAGRLGERPLAELLGGPAADKLRPEVRACHACWEVCTARSGIRNHLGRVGLWVAWNKLLAHAGRWTGEQGTRLFPATLMN